MIVSGGKPYAELTPQQQLAVDIFVAGSSEWDAYRQAGYAGRSSGAAARMFSRLKRAIAERRCEAVEKRGITSERIMDVLVCIVESDPLDLDLSDDDLRALPKRVRMALGQTKVTRVTKLGENGEATEIRTEHSSVRPEARTAAARVLLEAMERTREETPQEFADKLFSALSSAASGVPRAGDSLTG